MDLKRPPERSGGFFVLGDAQAQTHRHAGLDPASSAIKSLIARGVFRGADAPLLDSGSRAGVTEEVEANHWR
ncbi:hypothetical protein [Ciceribacter ferrooxidans]|uniref:Uncharacterized protein n=1 Tax=Ciceribacter ferrooxidans TaxID=2509717 RepID=A0A4Q2T877_9HYPH|nr:hypothetical protein [Ciceribacter ferrooxidans]RYC15236.1 hypothetical protein EUU22_09360 [Ciceribacter ferrooxidans]